MQLSGDYKEFIDKLDRIRPRCVEVGETFQLPLGNYEQDQDSGKGL